MLMSRPMFWKRESDLPVGRIVRMGVRPVRSIFKVLAELRQANLITSEESKMQPPSGLFFSQYVRQELSDISGVVVVQSGKSPEVMSKTAEVLRRHGFEKESKLLAVKAVLAELQQADLISSEECSCLQHHFWWDCICNVVRVQSGKSPEVISKTADVLKRHGFEKESRLLTALVELQQAHLITSEECEGLSNIGGVVEAQSDKSPKVVVQTATVLQSYGFEEASRLLTDFLPHHADKVDLHHLVEDEWSRLSAQYHSLKNSVGALLERLPEQSRIIFRQAYRALSSTARRMSKRPKASKVLDARDLRRKIEALHDPELLQQLSSYEEDNLKPFIVNFLDRCRETGVKIDSSLPDVRLSPSTPAGQVLGFILSRKDYYITDLHIDREHFSPWDVDTPPPARVPPTLNGPDHHRSVDALLTSYSTLFTEVVENVETLPRQQYLNLKSHFQYQPHTEVHLPSSRMDVRDCLHCTPLFAPLCTALLRKVVWFLFTHDADDLSHKLEDYEKKLATFVSQFLLACHVEGVVPPTGGMALHEDGCDLSDPTHLLACVLALKPYYMGSLHMDESLFTALEREGSLEGGGREENVSMDASPFEPTPPTSENESPGSSVPPQSKGKGKHRLGTSSSAVPASQSETWTGTDSGGSDAILSRMVYDHPDQLKLFREWVSRAAAGKGRAVLEGVGLKAAQITACFRAHPLNEEEGIQTGLIEWSGGQGHQPPTWAVLLKAMSYAKVEQEYIQGLETDLGLH